MCVQTAVRPTYWNIRRAWAGVVIIGSRRRTPSSSVSPQMLTPAESVSSYWSALEWSLGSFRSQFSSYKRAGSAIPRAA